MNSKRSTDIYTRPCAKYIASRELSSGLCDGLEGCEGGSRGRGVCIHTADSRCHQQKVRQQVKLLSNSN